MKKLISMLLALVLLLCLPVLSFADASTGVYRWEEVGNTVLDYFADNTNFAYIEEVDAAMWVPGYFAIADLSEEDIADNCIGYLINADGSAFILLYYMDMPAASLNALLSSYQASGHTAKMITVNDVPAVLMEDSSSNSRSVSYQTQDNKLFQVFFFPASDENYSVIFDLMIASILPRDTEVADETAAEVAAPVNPVSGLISK